MIMSVHELEQLAEVLDAVTTATAGVQTPPELMPASPASNDDEGDEGSISDEGEEPLAAGNSQSSTAHEVRPDSCVSGGAATVDASASLASAALVPSERTLLGSLKLRYAADRQETLEESFFPYYADSTPESLLREAEEYVGKHNIPASHVPAIVQAAVAKRDRALAAAADSGKGKKKKKKSPKTNREAPLESSTS